MFLPQKSYMMVNNELLVIYFFSFFQMASSVALGLIEAHDILSPSSDTESVIKLMNQLRPLVPTCDRKDLQPVIANVNNCFHNSSSIQSKVNGLVILNTLVGQCPDTIFEELGTSWLQLVCPKLQVIDQASMLNCLVVKKLVKKAAMFPDVSRYFASIAPSVLTSLTALAEKTSFAKVCNQALETVITLFQSFPGSCGAGQKQVEKLLIANVIPKSKVECMTLARCLPLMPRLGGGGKEGIHHRANYVTMFQKLCYTLRTLIMNILAISPTFTKVLFVKRLCAIA